MKIDLRGKIMIERESPSKYHIISILWPKGKFLYDLKDPWSSVAFIIHGSLLGAQTVSSLFYYTLANLLNVSTWQILTNWQGQTLLFYRTITSIYSNEVWLGWSIIKADYIPLTQWKSPFQHCYETGGLIIQQFLHQLQQ